MTNMLMRRVGLLAVALLAYASVAGAAEGFRLIGVDELAKLMADDRKAVEVYDVNTAKVREQYGIVPGARLIGRKYDAAEMLPPAKDAKLVFYCSNVR